MAHSEAAPQPDPLAQGISDLSRRLRVLEERYTTLRRKGQITDENLLAAEKEAHDSLQKFSTEIVTLRKILSELDDKLDRFLEQVKTAAPREDVLILRKYLDMWDPMRYLTREEAQRLLTQIQKG